MYNLSKTKDKATKSETSRNIYAYIYIYIERERERKKEILREREGEKEKEILRERERDWERARERERKRDKCVVIFRDGMLKTCVIYFYIYLINAAKFNNTINALWHVVSLKEERVARSEANHSTERFCTHVYEAIKELLKMNLYTCILSTQIHILFRCIFTILMNRPCKCVL